MSVNKVILLGRVGKDPEVREVNGTKVANFSLATTERRYKTRDGKEVPERTEWHNLTAWRGLAEIAEKYIRKGTQIYVEGKIQTDKVEDRYYTKVIVSNIKLLGRTPESKAEDTSGMETKDETDDSGLPF